jgi:hypothetical protein
MAEREVSISVLFNNKSILQAELEKHGGRVVRKLALNKVQTFEVTFTKPTEELDPSIKGYAFGNVMDPIRFRLSRGNFAPIAIVSGVEKQRVILNNVLSGARVSDAVFQREIEKARAAMKPVAIVTLKPLEIESPAPASS